MKDQDNHVAKETKKQRIAKDENMKVFTEDGSGNTCNPDEITTGCAVKIEGKSAKDGNHDYYGVSFHVTDGVIDSVIHPPAAGN